jgi:predicted dehydrogenase
MTVRVALIGYGLAGSVFHAPLISSVPGLHLAGVVTGNPGRQESARSRYPHARILDHADQVWETAGSYDLAVVAAPNRQHVPLARAALSAGLPVVVDKPVAATVADARELAGLADERGLPVIPFHNRRWDGDFRTVRRLIDEGALGGVQRFESRFERWRPEIKPGWKESADPRDAGSILYDLGSHLVDQAVTLFGRPRQVYAEINVRRPGAVVADDVFIALTHPGGLRCHLWMSATAAHLGPRFRVLGGHAAYVVSGLDGQENALREGRTPLEDGWGLASPESYGLLGTPGSEQAVPTEAGAYQDFYAEVAQAIRGEASPPVPLADAILGLEVIEAVTRSAEEGRGIELG